MVFVFLTKNRQRAGFNLTEMAIVLAVVGTVIGGIWSAMNATKENANQDMTVSQIKQTVQNVRDFYQSVAETPAGNLTSDLIGHGAVVAELIRSRTLPFTAAHAWDASAGGGSVQINAAADRVNMFVLDLTVLSQRTCIGLVGKLTGSDGPRDLLSTRINGGAPVTGAVTPEIAVTLCNQAGATNTLSFTYRLR